MENEGLRAYVQGCKAFHDNRGWVWGIKLSFGHDNSGWHQGASKVSPGGGGGGGVSYFRLRKQLVTPN